MEEPTLANLTPIRKNVKAKLTRTIKWLESSYDVETSINVFKSRLDKFVCDFKTYDDVQSQIENLDERQESDRDTVELNYFKNLGRFQDKLDSFAQSSQTGVGVRSISPQNQKPLNSGAKIPDLKIPTFHGDFSQWSSFYDIFNTLIIKNPSLSNVQRLMHLKGCLTGEPLNLINNLQLTNTNFDIAIKTLTDRYENKLITINWHIKTLLEIPSLVKLNSHTLREFVTTIKQNIEALKGLKVPVDQWDLLLIYIYTQKLDFNTRRSYELEKNRSQLPTLQEFLEFLENRCVALECINFESLNDNRAKSLEKSKFRAAHYASAECSREPALSLANTSSNKLDRKCLFCNFTNHSLYNCLKFKQLSFSDKRQFVTNNKLCVNCLGTKHFSDQCNSEYTCMICSRKHHTLLHKDKTPSYPHRNTNSNSQNNSQANSQRYNKQNRNLERNISNIQPVHPSTASTTPNQSHSQVDSNAHSPNQNPNPNRQSLHLTHNNNAQILLATAVVGLRANNGKQIFAKALLDCGSQCSFVTAELSKKLGYKQYFNPIYISGIANNNIHANKIIDIVLHAKDNAAIQFGVSCSILENITCLLPQTSLDPQKLQLPSDIELADPQFYEPSKIDLLLGADIFFELIIPGTFHLGEGLPILFNTYLGYVIGGKNVNSHFSTAPKVSCYSQVLPLSDAQENSVETLIEKFWSIEEVENLKNLSPLDERAEEIFKTSTKRLENGKFQIDWPLIEPEAYLKLGDSFKQASKRFFSLEKRFCHDKGLFIDYKKFIDDYLDNGYAKRIPLTLTSERGDAKYFLPHHCVIREDSKSTKLRVVLDASMKTSTGYSLNDIVLKGFSVQPELFDILIRFRTYKFVLTSDIQKMFLQIKVNPTLRFLQNILWRENPSEDLQCLELSTVFFGNKSSPFIATRCLAELVSQRQITYPLAAQALSQQCYMDDCLSGADSESELYELKNQLIALLKEAGFNLHKWCSNFEPILQLNSNKDNNYKQPEKICIKDENVSNKVLGLIWKPDSDDFLISYPEIKISEIYTKRKVLSIIASMFDPLGLISPVIVIAKLIMQKIWSDKSDWDDVLNTDLLSEWLKFLKFLPDVKNLSIARYLFSPESLTEKNCILKIELHGYCDSSAKAYGCCLYLRTIYKNDTVVCNLICSKTRVAPIKKSHSIARLELCGCLLLSKLTKRTLEILQDRINIDSVNLWSDSQVALCWIKSFHSRWTVFVSNRVLEIQTLTSGHIWRYIPTEKNPADCLSRGMMPNKIEACNLWWHGPEFLFNPLVNLNPFEHFLDKNIDETLLEEKKTVSKITLLNVNNEFWDQILKKFSSYSKLQRVIAYVLRLKNRIVNNRENNCVNKDVYTLKRQNSLKDHRSTSTKIIAPLKPHELRNAEIIIIKQIQEKHFSKEITELQEDKPLNNKSILNLCPFIDKEGILRVGGRLVNAKIPYNQKHPVLLPGKEFVVKLLMRKEHVALLHAGPQTTLANFRTKFWPLGGLRAIKDVIRTCVDCCRFKAQAAQQIMAPLPVDRVTPARPFAKVGIDFGGPFLIRSSRLKKAPTQRCYMAMFVCFCTKAVHIELVSSLSTEAFVLSFRRFISRRGSPETVFSDNATNFVGTKNLLHDLYTFFRNKKNVQDVEEFLSTKLIQWKFIPPRSPHWGGLWEAAIKSAKYHIHRIVGNFTLTFEELSTVLIQVECILNSRPLTPLSDNPLDLNFLTPGHFLIGQSLSTLPADDLTEIPLNRLNNWQLCEKLKQHFWKKWSIDYLTRLQNRPKWLQPSENLKVNDLILLKEDNTPPLNWRRGRITEIIPGQDGKVRMVKVLTSEGIFSRSIAKVCPFPKG